MLDPEAMLLVDDHEAEPVEIDALAEQRVGPDRQVGSAARERSTAARRRSLRLPETNPLT